MNLLRKLSLNFSPFCLGNLKGKFFFSALYGFKPVASNAPTSSGRGSCHQMRQQAQGHCGFGGKACSRRTPRGGGGVQRLGGGATRLGEPTVDTRPQNARPRARSGPTSLTLAGRSGSLRGQRDREWRDAGPRRQQIQLVNRDSGKEATNAQGRRTESVSDARSRTGCPLTTAASLRQHVDRKGSAHFCSLRPYEWRALSIP